MYGHTTHSGTGAAIGGAKVRKWKVEGGNTTNENAPGT